MLVSRRARVRSVVHVTDVLAHVRAKNPAEPEFHQAVEEVLESLDFVVKRRPELAKAKILERIVEPERVIMFRVLAGRSRRNPGQSRLPRADERRARSLQRWPPLPQVRHARRAEVPRLRAGLQELPDHAVDGGGKGGSDFDPRDRSDNEVMRFCQSFMTELMRHIGPDTDVRQGTSALAAARSGISSVSIGGSAMSSRVCSPARG